MVRYRPRMSLMLWKHYLVSCLQDFDLQVRFGTARLVSIIVAPREEDDADTEVGVEE